MIIVEVWIYSKLYQNLVTFHCLTPNEAEPSVGQTVKVTKLWYNLQYSQNRDNNMVYLI